MGNPAGFQYITVSRNQRLGVRGLDLLTYFETSSDCYDRIMAFAKLCHVC